MLKQTCDVREVSALIPAQGSEAWHKMIAFQDKMESLSREADQAIMNKILERRVEKGELTSGQVEEYQRRYVAP